ncbi:dnaK protein [Tritrichomonas foetus]|uniref:DnaK protein n=1 Tax=Tritrichomonas foetus TaxID=1144522 RepID=A0A1J4J7C6_9EUKA|nr:dnaK protein [Tritrichomonas foetus]|eukprot:OHS94569.1 dnaK protein [Tritrichomonas foetus]
MLSIFIVFASSAVFGIDFGSEYIKVGMALPGKSVHIALNQQSKRLSPSYFAFWNNSNPRNSNVDGHWDLKDLTNCSWAFLDAAKSHTNRFPSNGVKGLSPLLENIHGFKRREIIALVLRHLISTVDDGNWKPETATIVFTVEPVFPYEERIAIMEAVKLTNATLAAIIDSPTAAANVYGLEKRSLFADKPKTVIFLDIGSTHTWAALFKFTQVKDKQDIEELAVSYNYSLGGNLIDDKVANLLMNQFYAKHKIEIKTEREIRQFYEEARRAKELLSINENVDIKMEDIIDDYSLNYKLERSEFEGMISEFNESLRNLIEDVVSKAQLSLDQVDSIELLGGTTRVPFVKKSIMHISHMNKLNRTMNSDEAMALGATYVGAAISGAFIVKTVKTKPFALINSSLILGNGERKPIFDALSRTTEKPVLLLTVEQCRQPMQIVSGENDTLLQTVVLSFNEDQSDTDEVQLRFGFNSISVPTLVNATVFNGKKRVRIIRTDPDWKLDNEQLLYSHQFIKKMDNILRRRRKIQQLRNDFESYLYKIKDKLEYDESFKEVTSPNEKKQIIALIDEDMKWFEETAKPSSKNITKKHSELKKLTREPEIRAEQAKKRDPAFKKLNSTLNTVFNSLNATWPMFRPWLPEKKVENLWTLYNSTVQWFEEKWKLQAQASPFDNPVVMAYEIDNKQKGIEKLYNQLKNMEKPKEKKKPVKKPAKAVNQTQANQTQTNQTRLDSSETNHTDENKTIDKVPATETEAGQNEVTDSQNHDVNIEEKPIETDKEL